MNCECIYYSKGASEDDLLRLAEKINKIGERVELYPCAVSRLDEKCKCFDDYDGWGKCKYIPKDSLVLFVGGKYHNMTAVRTDDGRAFKPLFPDPIDLIFTDLQTDF